MRGLPRKYVIGKPATHETGSFYENPGSSDETAEKSLGLAVVRLTTKEPAPPSKPAAATTEKRAIWIVHGMGEQVPFETVDSLAEGILSVADGSGPGGATVSGPPRFTETKFSEPTDASKTQIVQRVEIDIDRPNESPVELHLYEAYWAPVTEGVPKVGDVISFLFRGGIGGFMTKGRFVRAMFPPPQSSRETPKTASDEPSNDTETPKSGDGKQAMPGSWEFKIPRHVYWQILFVLSVLAALVGINGIITAASAAHLKLIHLGGWYGSHTWNELTALASGTAALLLSFGAILFLAVLTRPGKLGGRSRRLVTAISWVALFADALLILLVATWMALLCVGLKYFPGFVNRFPAGHWVSMQFVSTVGILATAAICYLGSRYRAKNRHARHVRTVEGFLVFLFVLSFVFYLAIWFGLFLAGLHGFTSVYESLTGIWGSRAQRVLQFISSPYWVWPALFALSKYVRELIVEYPGDVAVYVYSNKVDRFDQARQKIKQIALDSLMPLYSANSDGLGSPFLYSKVAIVGHSLGSVIAYDTLNKLMILDGLLGNQFKVAERTCVLETFGSPLDKIAFFFNILGEGTYEIREQLAASVQPLIQNYEEFRCFPWINVYSSSDIIGGPLTFYDVPGTKDKYRVREVKDPDSVVPLIAHVEYWKNPTLWRLLFAEVTR